MSLIADGPAGVTALRLQNTAPKPAVGSGTTGQRKSSSGITLGGGNTAKGGIGGGARGNGGGTSFYNGSGSNSGSSTTTVPSVTTSSSSTGSSTDGNGNGNAAGGTHGTGGGGHGGAHHAAAGDKEEFNIGLIAPHTNFGKRDYLRAINVAIQTLNKLRGTKLSFLEDYAFSASNVHFDMMSLTPSPTSKWCSLCVWSERKKEAMISVGFYFFAFLEPTSESWFKWVGGFLKSGA